MNHPIKAAQWLALSAQVFAILLLFINLVLWSLPTFAESMAYQYSSLTPATLITLNGTSIFLGSIVSTLYLALLAYALFAIAGIFRLIAQGNWFEAALSQRMKRFGLALLLFGLSTPLLQTVMTSVITLFNPPGQRIFSIGLNSNDYVIILIGFLMMMLGRVLQEAETLAEENREIV